MSAAKVQILQNAVRDLGAAYDYLLQSIHSVDAGEYLHDPIEFQNARLGMMRVAATIFAHNQQLRHLMTQMAELEIHPVWILENEQLKNSSEPTETPSGDLPGHPRLPDGCTAGSPSRPYVQVSDEVPQGNLGS